MRTILILATLALAGCASKPADPKVTTAISQAQQAVQQADTTIAADKAAQK